LGRATLAVLAATCAIGAAHAQGADTPASNATSGYPNKPIRMIVPTTPAGITDIIARMAAQALTERLGQQVIVENRPGANGNIAAEFVARAPADGYTLMLGTIGVLSINPYLYKHVGYDPLRDFTPIGQLVSFSNILAVNPELPVHDVRELIAYAKARPGKLSYASSGVGGSPHMAMASFLHMAGLDVVHVPYKGSAPAIQDVVSGQVQMTFGDPIATLPFVRSGKLRALAVSGDRRLASAPDIPTVAQAGLPGYSVNGWLGIAAPRGTPPAVVQKLNATLDAWLQDPATVKKLESMAADPTPKSAAQFGQYVQAENKKWSELVRATNLSAE
jgi:tripartite-type tricarboxylate transporter receptor subunit TctC